MARSLGARVGIVLISGSIGCLLYTDPVNVAPKVTINVPSMRVRGSPITFTANATDDQSTSSLRYTWGAADGACPAGGALPAPGAFPPGNGFMYPVTVNDYDGHCVFVTVTDEQGAAVSATATFAAIDRPPTVTIQRKSLMTQALVQGDDVPLYSQLRYTAPWSDLDGDVVTLTWMLTDMNGASTPPPCPDAPDDVCIQALTPGSYMLSVSATDSAGVSGHDSVSYVVADDQPPCIVETDPPTTVMGMMPDPTKDLMFTVVTVDDDGDPVPALLGQSSMASFAWSWRLGGSGDFTRKVLVDLPSFTIPAGTYHSGQHLELRVEARDRLKVAATCDQNDPVCPWPASSCSQWVTWSVVFQ